MARTHRVFFRNEAEALLHGLRPCGHCMPEAFRQWRAHGINALTASVRQGPRKSRPSRKGEKA